MDHIVYLDTKAKEFEKILEGTKNMIIRGAAGRKVPYGRVNQGDRLFFIRNNAEGLVKAKAIVKFVFNSEKMDKVVSENLVKENQEKLQLTEKQLKRWAGKKYIVLIEIESVENIEPFKFSLSNHSNMDDWLIIENIDTIIEK